MLIPAMKTCIDHSSAYGVESFVMGMPHRYYTQPVCTCGPLLCQGMLIGTGSGFGPGSKE